MTRLISGVLFVGLLLCSSAASALTSYACGTRRIIGSTYGTAGATYVHYYSEPHCAGTLYGTRYYCSSGSTSSLCSSSTSYQYGAAELNAFFTVLQTAAFEGVKVNHFESTCNGGSNTDCGTYFVVYGVP